MEEPTGGRTLVRNNLSVASGTMLSRLTGLVRTVLVVFAVQKSLGDVYLLANNTPNIIYELILGGVLTATLVPIFTEDIERRDDQATAAVISFTIVALGVLTVLAALAAPMLIFLYGTN
jgi:putative peptidoglycan lipid II flippase